MVFYDATVNIFSKDILKRTAGIRLNVFLSHYVSRRHKVQHRVIVVEERRKGKVK